MTEKSSGPQQRGLFSTRVQASLEKRNAAERHFRAISLGAVFIALGFLAFLLGSIGYKGLPAFSQTMVRLDIAFDEMIIDPQGKRDIGTLSGADYQALIKTSLRQLFPETTKRRKKRDLYRLVSSGAAFDLRRKVLSNTSIIGTTKALFFPASDDVDMLIKNPEQASRLKEHQIIWIKSLQERSIIETHFNTRFFSAGDSREPELAGIWGAAVGSFLTLLVTLVLSFPIGVASAVYLEEFAPHNRWTHIIEININNLAAVPSIVFGLLGLALFLNLLDLPRSAPLVGGLVLTLMTLPTVIIAGRAALKGVPPSIREAALALGASPIETVFHHVLPLAMPGMLTGAIIGMSRALGETAPLLMIGMVAFIVDIPQSIMEPATALPVQIYLWADSPERAFAEKTAAAIVVLLAFLILMNAMAVSLRKKYEVKW
jgi:phosphate transport system permease protein